MATVSKTLSWQITSGATDHYEIGIATTASGIPTLLKVTTDNATSTTVEYDAVTYPTAWFFVRAVAADGTTSDWSDPISSISLTPTYTPPQAIQYAYSNDITDLLSGITIPPTITTRMLNKACLDASRRIDTLTNRKFTTQTVVEKYDGNGTSKLTLQNYPITKLNYVKIKDYSGLEIIREYNSTDLELSDFEAGVLQLKPVSIDNIDSNLWNSAASLLYGHVFLPGKRNVEVSYEYGHLFYAEGEELQYIESVTNGSSAVTTRTYQAIHHNWAANDIAIYKNGTLMVTDVSVDTIKGIVSVADGADDDIITAYYYHTVPYDIESACARMAAIDILNQVIGKATGGVTSFRNMNYQETYGTKAHGSIFDSFKSDVNMILQKYIDYNFYAV
jgi:hypothetical protein